MVKTDVQVGIDKVYWRATHTLPEEFIDINVSGPFPERGVLYKTVENDFKSYSTLGDDLIEEVNTNLSSDLRPAERIKYITNLNSYLYELKDGYEFIESDEWVDRIFIVFNRPVFESDTKQPHLTEEDEKYIFEIVEVVRNCCYEFSKAADSVASIIRPELIGNGIKPKKFPTSALPPEASKPNPIPKPTSSNDTVLAAQNIVPQSEKSIFKTLPPKILLLDKLGFFKLPEVQRLSLESKGKLVSALCGGSSDNAVDYIRQCDSQRTALEKNPYRNPDNIRVVEDFFNTLNKS